MFSEASVCPRGSPLWRETSPRTETLLDRDTPEQRPTDRDPPEQRPIHPLAAIAAVGPGMHSCFFLFLYFTLHILQNVVQVTYQ